MQDGDTFLASCSAALAPPPRRPPAVMPALLIMVVETQALPCGQHLPHRATVQTLRKHFRMPRAAQAAAYLAWMALLAAVLQCLRHPAQAQLCMLIFNMHYCKHPAARHVPSRRQCRTSQSASRLQWRSCQTLSSTPSAQTRRTRKHCRCPQT